jgi:hypothetical protein
MSEASATGAEQMSRDDMMSALFAHMIMQQSNIAMMMLGKVAHPETGQTMQDLEGAKLFIDQLEMLEAKTKGNLSKEEEHLLKQSLMSLRLAFVETVNAAPAESSKGGPEPETSRKEPAAKESRPTESKPVEPTPAAEESHKKFSKKY